MTRTHKRITFFIVLALIGVFIAIQLSRPDPIHVSVYEVERGIVEDTVANTRAGTVQACRRAKLSPAVGGQLTELPIKEGDEVVAGQLLLALWNDDLKAQVNLAEREAKAAKAGAQATCLQAEVADREAKRLQRLQQSGAVSDEQLDQAVTRARASQAECISARANAEVSQARLDVAGANLARTLLLAPFDGVIAEINGELNEYVTPSPPGIPTPPAVDLIDNTCFYVSAPIDEVDAAEVEVDMPARITLDAFGDREFPGRVRRIADYVLDVEKQARTVAIEVEFVNPPETGQLLAGYSADTEIILAAHTNVLRVPTLAILEGPQVLVLNPEDEELELRDITTGLSNWEYTEVTGGLNAGERVVTSLDQPGVEAGVYAVVNTP